jgi:hypothetical protein
MDAFGFVAKLYDELILERSRYQSAGFFESVAILAGLRSSSSEDEIAVRIGRLISRHRLQWEG